MLRASDGVLQRFHVGFQHTRDTDAGRTLLHIQFQLDEIEQGIVVIRTHGAVDLQHGRSGIRPLALHNGGESLALRAVSALVDNGLHGAVAVVDGAGPTVQIDRKQTIQPRIPEMPFVYAPGNGRLARTVGRERYILARATIRAIAIDDVWSLDTPSRVGHIPPFHTLTDGFRL